MTQLKQVLNNRAVQVAVVLMVGAFLVWYVMNTAPTPKRVTPQPVVRLVDVEPLEMAQSFPYWRAGGQVLAADKVELMPQVSGRVVSINPLAQPGAQLAKGTWLLRLEKADFELQVKQKQAALAKANADLKMEQGQVSLAQEEYAIAARELSAEEKALVMREPQLAKIEAEVATAKAELEQAQLNLARSEVRMPFDGQIQTRYVSEGSQTSTSTALFNLVRTDRFWIEVKVPRSFLSYLDQQGEAPIQITGSSQPARKARILNVLPTVADTDRQAVVLLQLDDPLDGNAPILANDFVQVQLPGKAFAKAVAVPTRFIQDDGSVWVVNQNTLRKRTPEILFRGREYAWVGAGFEHGDALLKNRVDAAVEGMAVRVQNAPNVIGSAQ